MSRLLSLALALALAAPPAAPPLAAQERPHEETAQVVEVEVPVNVVLRDGEPLRGLKLEDFEVLDEGRPQKITGMRLVDLATSEPAALDRQVPSTSRRHFLLLFDLSFSNPTSVVKARLAARDFVLRSLHPTDLAAVATYSLETGPRLVITFTPDRAQLARALDTLGFERASHRPSEVDPLKFMIANAESGASGISSDSATGGQRAAAEAALVEHLNVLAKGFEKSRKTFDRSRISAFTRSLGATAKALNAVKGRKQVIYF